MSDLSLLRALSIGCLFFAFLSKLVFRSVQAWPKLSFDDPRHKRFYVTVSLHHLINLQNLAAIWAKPNPH